jgi:hypothetical protein
MNDEGRIIVAHLLERLTHFRPEDRQTFFEELKKRFCLECGSLAHTGKIVRTEGYMLRDRKTGRWHN